ncbi:hypothetical protein [Sinosporangium album]|nr:hypothetical protein [Sinosporangium album]
MFLPPSFAQTLRLECIRIDDYSNSHRWVSVPGKIVGTWCGSEATEVIDLVAGLQPSEMTRCFLPGYGIRAHGADHLLFEIAFCFQCHNALLLVPGPKGQRDLVGFNAESQCAQELLNRFRTF